MNVLLSKQRQQDEQKKTFQLEFQVFSVSSSVTSVSPLCFCTVPLMSFGFDAKREEISRCLFDY